MKHFSKDGKTSLLISLIAFILVINLISCSSTKKLAVSNPSTVTHHETNAAALFDPETPQFSSWNVGKCKVSLTMNDRNYIVPASLKIVKDSLIALSIQPFLGIEMYRAELTPDSITLIDRGNHLYFSASYDMLAKRIGVPIQFKDIQAVLTNDVLQNTSNPTLMTMPSDSLVTWRATRNAMQINYDISKTNLLMQTSITLKDSPVLFQCTYNEFKAMAQKFAPTHFQLLVSDINHRAEMDLTYDNININNNVHPKPFNTSRYQRVNLEQILPF
ncbi:MAG: DUF4292 domain-containing protein [Microbacter sp.]